VHHFVPHVDRRTEQFDGAFDDFDRAIDAGTESTRIGEQDLHFSDRYWHSQRASAVPSAVKNTAAMRFARTLFFSE
jgi:hypothetical protein